MTTLPESDRAALWLDGVKYLLVTVVEACVDVPHHIGSSESYVAPDSNAEALRSLGVHGVVESALAESLARAVGFRHMLVHQYTTVDDAIVRGALERLDEFDAFVAQVSSWLVGR